MLVISHPYTPAALPQPSGPSIKAEPLPAEGLPPRVQDAEVDEQLSVNAVRSARLMGRSTSMFQPTSRLASSSSRSTTPASSANSSAGQATVSTPSSTVHSGSVRDGCKRKPRSEPYVDVVLPPSAPDDPAAIPYDVPVDTPIPPFARRTANPDRDLARVWEAVAGARRITVICGAGISVSSPANIPDFRSTAGLFRKLKEKHPNAGLTSGKDLFDASLFNSPSTSSLFYSMIAELKAMADAAAPTTFHHLLKRLDMEGRLQRVYTQNIDGLEERAGLSFGLGESGDSRATLRALGKRKRKEQGNRLGAFARSKSDSAVLFTQKQEAERRIEEEEMQSTPMFPRTIPLHGSLSTLSCAVCNHKIYLSLASSGPQRPTSRRELSPDAPDQALAAMDLLSQGEAVACVKCEDYERVRSVAGLRSRGVGIMKVDVVLYNGQNDGAEQVGECVQRDILGLRDPNETSVPESLAEKMARERRERKEREGDVKRKEAAAAALEPIAEAGTADDAFASAFGDDGEQEAGKTSVGVGSSMPRKQARAARLKPLPPDLLIVAGTSLKVPGTKRIVREFAKACHARDHRVYPSSDESDDEGGRARSKATDDAGAQEWEEEEGEEDINAPIRTILLNYDFPVPPSQWDGVFDVWVQGNVQQSALGLWEASKYAMEDAANSFSMQADEGLSAPQLSWSTLQATLEEERRASKKSAGKRSSSQQGKDSTPPASQQTNTTQAGAVKPKAKAVPKAKPVRKAAAPARAPKKASAAPMQEGGLEQYMRPTKGSTRTGTGKKKVLPS